MGPSYRSQNSRSVMGDAFIKAYIDDLLKNIRTQVRTIDCIDWH